ncbi:general secretion pathway protein GspB [Luteimonas sp. A501]
MSLILEALRKSEAERRRGEAPGLRVELPPLATAARRNLPAWTWTWIAGAALVLVLLLVALWPRGSGTGVGDDGAPAATTSAPVPSPATPSTGMPRAGDSDAFPQVDRITPREPASRMPTPPEAGPAETALPASASETANTAPASRPALRPATDAPRITELPTAQRQRLPAMKLTMHMWNEDPVRRFVVIDGQRKAEGDRIGEASVTAIDRDGILLELDGRPIRVPLP